MSQLNGKRIIVTGGSRGFGRGIVEALATQGAMVYAIARDAGDLNRLKREVKGVQTCAADVSDPQVAPRILGEVRPDILILNAGAQPSMLPLYEQSWEEFDRNWDTDVKATFYFCKEAFLMPMRPVSTVIVVSSGAATAGNAQMVGSYASAKRMQWFLARNFQEEALNLDLGIRFITLVPRLTDRTALGRASLAVFAARAGISDQAFLARFGVVLTPDMVGHSVVNLLTDRAYENGFAFGFSEQGLLKALDLPSAIVR